MWTKTLYKFSRFLGGGGGGEFQGPPPPLCIKPCFNIHTGCGTKVMHTQGTAVVRAIGWCTWSISNCLLSSWNTLENFFVPQILETGKWPSLYNLNIRVNKHQRPPERFIIPIHTWTLVLMDVNCLPLTILTLTVKWYYYRQFCLPFFIPGPLKVTLFSVKNNNADCPRVEVLNIWAHVTPFPIPGWGIYNLWCHSSWAIQILNDWLRLFHHRGLWGIGDLSQLAQR